MKSFDSFFRNCFLLLNVGAFGRSLLLRTADDSREVDGIFDSKLSNIKPSLDVQKGSSWLGISVVVETLSCHVWNKLVDEHDDDDVDDAME